MLLLSLPVSKRCLFYVTEIFFFYLFFFFLSLRGTLLMLHKITLSGVVRGGKTQRYVVSVAKTSLTIKAPE